MAENLKQSGKLIIVIIFQSSDFIILFTVIISYIGVMDATPYVKINKIFERKIVNIFLSNI